MNRARAINVALLVVVLVAVAGIAWLYLDEHTRVGNSQRQPEPVSVIAQQVRLQPVQNRIQALGTARASQSIKITPEVSGIIETIAFQQGSRVEVGEVLVKLQADEARARFQAARATVAKRKSTYQRKRQLHASGLISDAELEQAKTQLQTARAQVAVAEATLANHILRAPFSGRLGLRRVSKGSLVQPSTVITTLDDITPIKVDFAVPGRFIGTLSPSQTIVAHTTAYPETEFTGTVQAIATRVNPATRMVQIRAVLRNPKRLIKPGMLLTMRLVRGTQPAIMIPELAIVAQNDKQFVFVIEDGKAQKRLVQTGRRRPGKVEITKGLKPSEVIVVEGTLKLRNGTPVKRTGQKTTNTTSGPTA